MHSECAGTLNAPLEKGLAALAGPHAVVVAGGVVAAHGAEVHVGFPHGGRAQGGVHAFVPLLGSLPRRLDGAVGKKHGLCEQGTT